MHKSDMPFYFNNKKMAIRLKKIFGEYQEISGIDYSNEIAITWLIYPNTKPNANSGLGAGWHASKLIYPASIVKIVYALAIEIWIKKSLIIESPSIRDAVKNMIQHSSNEATSFIVDCLTATTSGFFLNETEFEVWESQRNIINSWLQSLNWQELNNLNCCQKTWADQPYGRDAIFYGIGQKNKNKMSTEATARLFESIMTNLFFTEEESKYLKSTFSRSLNFEDRKANKENQIDGFLGEGISYPGKLWSKAGLMSQARHDLIWWEGENKPPILLVVFGEGERVANDNRILPFLAEQIILDSYKIIDGF
tara:strand:+ start:2826 stop:3752 length:927 start_codon:yes stop_codon:yes gene_type:complete